MKEILQQGRGAQPLIIFFLIHCVSKNNSYASERDLATSKKRKLFIRVFINIYWVKPTLGGCTDIVNLDITDGSPAGDAGRAGRLIGLGTLINFHANWAAQHLRKIGY